MFVTIFIGMLLSDCSDNKVKSLNEVVDIENRDGHFNIILDRNTEEEWKYYDVDSVAVSTDGLPVIVYGRTKVGYEKKWFFVTGSNMEFKKGFGDWYDGEFRKYRLDEVDPSRILYQTLRPSKDLWDSL
jgi:hypothetical protein